MAEKIETATRSPARGAGPLDRPGTVGVTGATGFVGGAVCRELERHGWKVVPLVRTPAGLADERVLGDLADRIPEPAMLRGLDAIVHAAARVHVMNDKAVDPLEEHRRVNTAATLRLARTADEAGVRRFLFISSIKVNGEDTAPGRPYRSDATPAPVDAYGISKLEAEQALAELAARSRLDVVVIRPALVYGPGVKANFAALITLVRRGIPLPLGRVVNRRSLIFVRNLADLIALCLVHPAAPGRTFLAADGDAVSTPELVTALARVQGRRIWLVPFPVRVLTGIARLFGKQAVVRRLTGYLEIDAGETRHLLDWTPPFTLDEGLAATVARDDRAGA